MVLPKLIREHPQFDESQSEEANTRILEECYQQFLAFIFLEQSDQAKYGTLLTGLNTQHSLQNDQYPKTMSQATNVLSNHKHDNASSRRERQRKSNDNKSDSGGDKDDEKDEAMPLSFAQIEGKCYCCGKPGHKSPECRHKDKPKPEWWINKRQQHLKPQQTPAAPPSAQSNTSSDSTVSPPTSPTETSPAEQPSAWMGVHLAHVQLLERYPTTNMQEWILLDSQSSTSIFCNPKYVTNIRDIPDNAPSLKVQTNGGTFEVRKQATVDNFGTVWFDPNSITNIFSHAEMADKYRITYDNHDKDQGDAFDVHTPVKTVRFR